MRISTALALGLLLLPALRAQAPSNNECAGYISLEIGINPSPPLGQSGMRFSNIGATDSSGFAAANCVPITKDVFFAVSPTCTGNHRVSLCTPPGFSSGTLNDAVLEIYPFACSGIGPPIACIDDVCGFLPETTFFGTAGVSYLVRVGSYGTTAAGSFHISVFPIDLPNDVCANAAPLSPGLNSGTTVCASPGAAPVCFGFAAGASDVWHSFTPTQNCSFSVALTGSGGDSLAVYSGSCSSLAALACISGQPPLQTIAFLGAAGSTYYVRVGETEYNGIGGFGPFTLDVQCFTAASADECAGAAPVFDGINPGAPNGQPAFGFNNNGATNSAGFSAPCGGPGGHNDVFFHYTSTIDGVVNVRTCTPVGLSATTLPDSVLSVYDASACPNGGVPPLACNDDSCGASSSLTFTAVFGASYLIRVASFYSGNTGAFYLTIDPTLNETCATAQIIGHGTTHGTTFGAVADGTAGYCAVAPSTWYTFTTQAHCDVQLVPSAPAGTVMSLLSNGCGGVFLDYGCTVNNDPVILREVSAGSTFFIEVFAPTNASPGPFSFFLAITPPVNDDCWNAIQVFDGINPGAPMGADGFTFSNFGATGIGYGNSCLPAGSDVYFTYVAQCTGNLTISTDIPPGFGGDFGADTRIHVLDAGCGSVLACDDDGGQGYLSRVTFFAHAGSTYRIRVGAYAQGGLFGFVSLSEHSFYLTVERQFCLSMHAPLGPGSLRLGNYNGPPNTACVSFFTIYQGTFPNGPFFGLDPSLTEISLQLGVGAPPFINILDANGESSFGPLTGAPSGLTLYGVSLALNGFLQFGPITPPTSFTIP